MFRKICAIVCFSLIPVMANAGFSSSAPEAWEVWEDHNASSAKTIDHSSWDALLKKYIQNGGDGLNRFAYASVSDSDQKALKQYLGAMSNIEISQYSRPVQLAYWVNLYNALTVAVILEHYPVKSIRDIDISGVFSKGPWGKDLLTIEGEDVSLDAIEHEILRPIWRDPRIHYAVNCASVGCPNLHDEAFTAKNADRLMDRLAADYINSPRGLKVENGKITVSKIYDWFAYDFGNSEGKVIQHLSKYADGERKAALTQIGRISKTEYDWSLNE